MRLSATIRALLLAAALAACGDDSAPEPSVAAGAAAQASSTPPPKDKRAPQDDSTRARQGFPEQHPRGDGPGLERARRALERGDATEAGAALLALGDGLEETLLRARLAALEGDGIGAVRRIEAARAAHPDQSEVYATASEIHAADGRASSAEDEVREGLARCGPTPALSRARGVLALARTGGARVALEHLLDARAVDPRLPFLEPALFQAQLLLGRQALAAELPLDAIGHARAGLLLEPGEVEARTLLGDAQAAAGRLGEALETFEGLLADGARVRDTLALLSQRAATAALVEGRRDTAVERYLRARELGLAEADLGFGATLLAEAADAQLAQGLAAYGAGELETAGEHFARALRLDPALLAARNHLAVALFLQERYAEAATHWRDLLARARADGVALPEPVELNLAKALALDGRDAEARDVLESWLADAPESGATDTARALLADLDARRE